MLDIILLVLSVISLFLAAIGINNIDRFQLGWLGLVFFVLTFLTP